MSLAEGKSLLIITYCRSGHWLQGIEPNKKSVNGIWHTGTPVLMFLTGREHGIKQHEKKTIEKKLFKVRPGF
jgi:hypothetical protein